MVMKTINRISLAAAIAALFATAAAADGGLAASPRLSQSRETKGTEFAISSGGVTYTVAAVPDYIAASPKVAQAMGEGKASIAVSAGNPVVSSTVNANASVAASPRARAQLTERPVVFEVAPLK